MGGLEGRNKVVIGEGDVKLGFDLDFVIKILRLGPLS